MEARVGVEHAHLAVDGIRELRVPVTDGRDVVDHVDVGPASSVDEVVTPAALDAHRSGVVVLLHLGEYVVAAMQEADDVVGRHREVGAEHG